MSELTVEIHPSEVNAGLLCPLRLDESLKQREPSYDMLRGSLTHDMIESNLWGVEPDPWTFLKTRLDEEYGFASIDDFGYQLQLTTMVHEAGIAYEKWKTHVRPQLSLLGVTTVEQEFRSVIDEFVDGDNNVIVELVGTPDLIDANGVFHDWKTARKAWSATKVPSQCQPPLYTWLAYNAPKPFIFWVFDFTVEAWTALPIVPTIAQQQATLDLARTLAKNKHYDTLPANPGVPPAYATQTRNWWCSPKYCESWNNCTARHLVNDGNDDVVRDWREGWT